MYRFSRAIFVEIKDLVDPHPETISEAEAKRYVLHCSEATIERLARDPRYFAKPSQSLFSEIRHLFSISDQARVYRSIDRHICKAIEFIMEELERAGEGTAQHGIAAVRRPVVERLDRDVDELVALVVVR